MSNDGMREALDAMMCAYRALGWENDHAYLQAEAALAAQADADADAVKRVERVAVAVVRENPDDYGTFIDTLDGTPSLPVGTRLGVITDAPAAPTQSEAKPVAWLVTSSRGLVRCAWTEQPTEIQLAVAEADGDTVTPLYLATRANAVKRVEPGAVVWQWKHLDGDKWNTHDHRPNFALTERVEVRALGVITDAPAAPAPPVWRCFHCDECFNESDKAAEHFGTSLMHEAGCQIDIAKYREMEKYVESARDEDTAAYRSMHRLQSEHQTALLREEEKGYARGLADAQKFPSVQFRYQGSADWMDVDAREGVVQAGIEHRVLSAPTQSEAKPVWVLTMEVNDYHQHGEYFIAAFLGKPCAEDLMPYVKNWFWGPNSSPIEKLLDSGGGRQKVEDEWFNLREEITATPAPVKPNEN